MTHSTKKNGKAATHTPQSTPPASDRKAPSPVLEDILKQLSILSGAEGFIFVGALLPYTIEQVDGAAVWQIDDNKGVSVVQNLAHGSARVVSSLFMRVMEEMRESVAAEIAAEAAVKAAGGSGKTILEA